MKKAVINGVTGQVGSYLAELLLAKGYRVVGMVRRASTENFERVAAIRDRLELRQADLLDQLSLIDLVRQVRPDEIYNLAAQSHVRVSFDEPEFTGDVTGPIHELSYAGLVERASAIAASTTPGGAGATTGSTGTAARSRSTTARRRTTRATPPR